jgi:hypothetical protein
MGKLQAYWVHGTAVQMEREGYFVSKQYSGCAAKFNTHLSEWFHFAIPTPVIIDGHRPKLKKVFVFYQTTGTAKLTAIHVYDAGKKIKAWDDLSLTGDHSVKIDEKNSWNIAPALTVYYGLGLSVNVNFGSPTPGKVPGIWFMTAGADFETS